MIDLFALAIILALIYATWWALSIFYSIFPKYKLFCTVCTSVGLVSAVYLIDTIPPIYPVSKVLLLTLLAFALGELSGRAVETWEAIQIRDKTVVNRQTMEEEAAKQMAKAEVKSYNWKLWLTLLAIATWSVILMALGVV